MKSLLDKFLSLRCAGDVLESVQPLTGDVTRRICESMALIEAIRPLVLKHRSEYRLVEFCYGAPLTSIIAAHLLPIEDARAFVTRSKFDHAAIERVKNFRVFTTVDLPAAVPIDGKTIVVSPSVRGALAMDVAKWCNAKDAPMAIIPSRGKVKLSSTGNAVAKLTGNRYFAWLQDLAESCNGKLRVPMSLVDSRITNCCLVTRGL